MARYLGPKCKLARREGTDLFLKSGVKPYHGLQVVQGLPDGDGFNFQVSTKPIRHRGDTLAGSSQSRFPKHLRSLTASLQDLFLAFASTPQLRA